MRWEQGNSMHDLTRKRKIDPDLDLDFIFPCRDISLVSAENDSADCQRKLIRCLGWRGEIQISIAGLHLTFYTNWRAIVSKFLRAKGKRMGFWGQVLWLTGSCWIMEFRKPSTMLLSAICVMWASWCWVERCEWCTVGTPIEGQDHMVRVEDAIPS